MADMKIRTLFALLPGLAGCLLGSGSQIEHQNVAFAVSRDGAWIVFSAADGDLYLLHLATLQVRRLTESKAVESTPAFSPDGKSIVYAADSQNGNRSGIFLRSLDGKKVRQVTGDANVYDTMPVYSPDGSEIVFGRAFRHRPYSLGGWTWDDW